MICLINSFSRQGFFFIIIIIKIRCLYRRRRRRRREQVKICRRGKNHPLVRQTRHVVFRNFLILHIRTACRTYKTAAQGYLLITWKIVATGFGRAGEGSVSSGGLYLKYHVPFEGCYVWVRIRNAVIIVCVYVIARVAYILCRKKKKRYCAGVHTERF